MEDGLIRALRVQLDFTVQLSHGHEDSSYQLHLKDRSADCLVVENCCQGGQWTYIANDAGDAVAT